MIPVYWLSSGKEQHNVFGFHFTDNVNAAQTRKVRPTTRSPADVQNVLDCFSLRYDYLFEIKLK